MVATVELPRVSAGLFGADGVGKSPKLQAKKSPKLQGKRPHDDVTLLGAMDMALPAAARRKGDGGDGGGVGVGVADAGEMPSFGQQLAAMGAAAPAADGAAGGKGKKPTAASQVALLVQALQNGDAAMLDQVRARERGRGVWLPAAMRTLLRRRTRRPVARGCRTRPCHARPWRAAVTARARAAVRRAPTPTTRPSPATSSAPSPVPSSGPPRPLPGPSLVSRPPPARRHGRRRL